MKGKTDQGSHGAEGPWRRRQLVDDDDDDDGDDVGGAAALPGPVWPSMEAFGSQVLPRDLSLFPDGSLRMVPVPELASLRKGNTPIDQIAFSQSIKSIKIHAENRPMRNRSMQQ